MFLEDYGPKFYLYYDPIEGGPIFEGTSIEEVLNEIEHEANDALMIAAHIHGHFMGSISANEFCNINKASKKKNEKIK